MYSAEQKHVPKCVHLNAKMLDEYVVSTVCCHVCAPN
jgi:hypothetical protein